ncbi:PAS domain-containing protein [Siccationidurans soli]|uniref:histidine kinase n=2 Tax=Hymenobacter negativus TaxID=2795026 RepID=A0ABS3QA74_9BACT|nr:PAS domain-containing protein [Hymenobacter negativus]
MASLTPVDYQSLFHALPGSYLLLAPDGTVVDNSDQHVAVSMLPRAQSQGRNIFDAYPSAPESQRDLDASHEQVRRTLRPDAMPLLRYDLERPAEQGGGTEERYWQITHHPILDAQGQLQYILQMPQDVTEQHRATLQAAEAQKALDEARLRTDFILESLPVLVWTNRPDGTPDYFNPRWLELTGKKHEELITESTWDDITHPDDRANLVQAWQDALRKGQLFQHEYRLRRHDGQYRWLLIRVSPRLDAEGRITMWVGAGSDITEQRQMVQELLQANEQQAILSDQAYQTYRQAEVQRETYESLFMQAPALICILRGPDFRYDFVNTRYQDLFRGRQLVGLPLVDALPELQSQGIVELLENVYSTGETFYGNEVPLQLQRPDGTAFSGFYNFTYQRFSEANQPTGIMVSAFDVTALVQARHALERLRDAGPTGFPPG